MEAQFASASAVHAPMCGVMRVFGIFVVMGVAKSHTKRPSLPERSAASTAGSSTMSARA